MKTIRQHLFETNSSSIHAITIGNNGEDFKSNLPEKIVFGGGEFGWEHEIYDDVQDKANYLRVSLSYVDNPEELQSKITKILEKWGVESEWIQQGGEYNMYIGGVYSYVDHGYENRDLVETLANNEELLMNYLFSKASTIETGNDNEDIQFRAPTPNNVLLEYEKGN